MNSNSAKNLITLGKLLKRYKLTTRGRQEIIKVAQKRSTTSPGLKRLTRKIKFKESLF